LVCLFVLFFLWSLLTPWWISKCMNHLRRLWTPMMHVQGVEHKYIFSQSIILMRLRQPSIDIFGFRRWNFAGRCHVWEEWSIEHLTKKKKRNDKLIIYIFTSKRNF
jgi:hypothetical protein